MGFRDDLPVKAQRGIYMECQVRQGTKLKSPDVDVISRASWEGFQQ